MLATFTKILDISRLAVPLSTHCTSTCGSNSATAHGKKQKIDGPTGAPRRERAHLLSISASYLALLRPLSCSRDGLLDDGGGALRLPPLARAAAQLLLHHLDELRRQTMARIRGQENAGPGGGEGGVTGVKQLDARLKGDARAFRPPVGAGATWAADESAAA